MDIDKRRREEMMTLNEVDFPSDPSLQQAFTEQVMRIATGFTASQILFHSDALWLIDLLKDGPRSLVLIAETCGIQPRPLERLLIGCCSLGLMKRIGDTFDLTEVSRNCLVRSEPGYVGGLFSFFKR